MKKYKHSFATYPVKYLGYVVSPHKICVQFEDVKVTTRVAYRDDSDLIKLHTTERALPVTTHGVGINILAVGTPIEEVLELQRSLFAAYREYANKHASYYHKMTGREFVDDLMALDHDMGELIWDLTKGE